MKLTDTLQNEYWFHVANQSEIPIAGTVDKSIDLELLADVAFSVTESEEGFKAYVADLIQENPNAIDLLRTLLGISDKRMYLELSYTFSKTRFNKSDHRNILDYSIYDLNKKTIKYFKGLLKEKNKNLRETSAALISNYLCERGLHSVLKAIRKVEKNELEVLVDNLILPKEVQQAEAKRRGHGAEHELAKVIHGLGLKMIPQDRYLVPIGQKDPNVDRDSFEVVRRDKERTWSFDLIILSPNGESKIFVQSLIHTSDPGQYGVNKSDETVLVKKDINETNEKYNTQKELWGMVDGVGFCENKKDTIDKMLDIFDCFIQIKSLYKVGLRLHKLGYVEIKGISFDDRFYNQEERNLMMEKYASNYIADVTNQKPNPSWTAIPAGMATLFV